MGLFAVRKLVMTDGTSKIGAVPHGRWVVRVTIAATHGI